MESSKASMGPRLFRRGNSSFRPVIAAEEELQWGHVFSDVEINGKRKGTRAEAGRFNGATSFQTWKWEQHDALSAHVLSASMGPRLFRRGNRFQVDCMEPTSKLLQWGHVFSDVEIFSAISQYSLDISLQWGHVFSDVEMPPSRGLFQPRSEGLFSSTPEKKSTPLLPIRFSGSKEASGAVREAPGIPPPPRLSQRLSPIVKEFRSPRPHAPPERRPSPPP